jgi:lactoylglutathione lyase
MNDAIADTKHIKTRVGSMRIAVASSDNMRINQHFGQTERFCIYDVDAGGTCKIEERGIADAALAGEGSRETVCRMLADCDMLLVSKIGITPQGMLAAAGIAATNLYAEKNIVESLLAIFSEKQNVADIPLGSIAFRLAHVMLRVADIDRSIAFYTEQLDMQLLEKREHQKNQFTQAYLGYGNKPGMVIELVFNWAHDTPYQVGDAYGHIAIEVDNITGLCRRLNRAQVPMPRPPRSQRHRNNIVAFIEDPDGYKIELIQPGENSELEITGDR